MTTIRVSSYPYPYYYGETGTVPLRVDVIPLGLVLAGELFEPIKAF